MIAVTAGRAGITGVVGSVPSSCAATSGGSGDTVHAGGGGCVADVVATGTGIGVWRSAVGDGASSHPRGVGGGLAFIFGEVADETCCCCASSCTTETGSEIGRGAVGGGADGCGHANAVQRVVVACSCGN